MLNENKVNRILKALLEGPMGQQLDSEAEAARAAKVSTLRDEFQSGQASYLTAVAKLETRRTRVTGQIEALKAQIDPLLQEDGELVWTLSARRGDMAEHRDRFWRTLTECADPRIAGYRAEFDARLRGLESMRCHWSTGPAPSQFEREPTVSNSAEIDRAGNYLLGAIDATHRWARDGVQGDELSQAYKSVMADFPRVPTSKNDRGQIPPPELEGPR